MRKPADAFGKLHGQESRFHNVANGDVHFPGFRNILRVQVQNDNAWKARVPNPVGETMNALC